jgi:D-alanyl-D-alanine carboxypeptidase
MIIPTLILFILYPASRIFAEGSIYGETDPFTYLTGRFDPAKNKQFILLQKAGIPCKGYHILRKVAAESLKKLYDDFHKEHPKTPFWVQSSTRNFIAQKTIWENKWKNLGIALKKEKKQDDPMAKGLAILTYSSMPGTSRHHWGTDFDLNVLQNSYFEKGPGKILYEWLKDHAADYGFCQPYGEGRDKGYAEEKWHWSYFPLSNTFRTQWLEMYEQHKEFFEQKGLFPGSEILGSLAPVYVEEVSVECR